jgi:polyribonucleotide nucleotidyltransferase
MHVQHSFTVGDRQFVFETGELARQASGAVRLQVDYPVLLATVVSAREPKPQQRFLPLTVDYSEKAYAAGRIPGGFFRREGPLSEKETLTCRLIDRAIRPLFPKGFANEIQVVTQVMSADPEIDPDIPALLAASAALAIAGVPFKGPLAAIRVGYADGQYVLNPTRALSALSQLDLVVAGTATSVVMVESGALELSEDVMLGAVAFGHEQMQVVIRAIDDFAAKAGQPRWEWTPSEIDEELVRAIETLARTPLEDAYRIRDKRERAAVIHALRQNVSEQMVSRPPVQFTGSSGAIAPALAADQADSILSSFEAKIVRGRILAGEPRIDGRTADQVRALAMRSGVLPRAHGSALFTRGETQAIAVTTLGTERDKQMVEGLQGRTTERFMFQYSMPPYATGETGRVGSPKRREVGHGRLARRALEAVLPSDEEFAYTIRVVSEVTESNGSSSMASVCGGCLALLDAGVPLKANVAGVAMGLIVEGERYAVLTDILGDEDHLGDMDFKVAGTEAGITALQMDLKVGGVTTAIMQTALAEARKARLLILAKMAEATGGRAPALSAFAPRLMTLKIDPRRIRDVIGKGGAVIRALTELTSTKIDIAEDGTVTITSTDLGRAEDAKRRIELLVAEVEVGQVYEGVVRKVLNFGAFVTILPGRDGLLHLSEISNARVEAAADHLSAGQVVRVKVLETDEQGRIRLSMRAVDSAPA